MCFTELHGRYAKEIRRVDGIILNVGTSNGWATQEDAAAFHASAEMLQAKFQEFAAAMIATEKLRIRHGEAQKQWNEASRNVNPIAANQIPLGNDQRGVKRPHA
jgi:hypothetical protein